MVWIDGEYFETPIEELKRKKTAAVTKAVHRTFIQTEKMKLEGLPSFSICAYAASGMAEALAILAQPLFPPEGGQIAQVNKADNTVHSGSDRVFDSVRQSVSLKKLLT